MSGLDPIIIIGYSIFGILLAYFCLMVVQKEWKGRPFREKFTVFIALFIVLAGIITVMGALGSTHERDQFDPPY